MTTKQSAESERVLGYVWKTKHSRACSAIKNVKTRLWETPWAYITGEISYGSKTQPLKRVCHRRGVVVRWVVVRCNDPSCLAKLYVLEDSILNLLPKARK